MLDFLSGLLGGGSQGGGVDGATPAPAPQYSPAQMKMADSYGLPPEMVAEVQRQNGFQAMGNIGAMLMAAGQAGPIGQRGQILAQMGNAMPDQTRSLLNAAQLRIYADTLKDRQSQRDADKALQETLTGIVQGKTMSMPVGTGAAAASPDAAVAGGAPGAPAIPGAPPATAPAGAAVNGLNISPQMAQLLLTQRPEARREIMQQVVASRLKGAEWTQPFKIGDNLFQTNASTGEMKQIGGSNTTINFNDQKLLEYDIKRLEGINKAVGESRTIAGPLEVAHMQLMNNMETGAIDSATLGVRNMLTSMGLMSKEDADKVSQQQLFTAVTKYIVPRLRVEGSGASSNLDVQMFEQASPTLEKTADGNLYATAYLRQNIRAQQAYATAADKYFRANNSLKGFDDYAEKNVPGIFAKVDGQPSPENLEKAGVRIGDMFFSAEAAKRNINNGFMIRRQ